MMERAGRVTMKGTPLTLLGPEVKPGDTAPGFNAVGPGLAPVSMADFAGRPCVFITVPSLDTSVCSLEAKRFDTEAASLGNVKVVTVSMDLPFAQKRWADEHEAAELTLVSDHRDASFGLAYGVLIKELRLLARAVFCVDSAGVVTHAQLVAEVSDEPDYAAALAAAKAMK